MDKTSIWYPTAQSVMSRYEAQTFGDLMKDPKQKRDEMMDTFEKIYDGYSIEKYGERLKKIVFWIYRRFRDERFCFQGGFGHRILDQTCYGHKITSRTLTYGYEHFPVHWCVKPEFYDRLKLTDDEKVILKMAGSDLCVSEIADRERWGN